MRTPVKLFVCLAFLGCLLPTMRASAGTAPIAEILSEGKSVEGSPEGALGPSTAPVDPDSDYRDGGIGPPSAAQLAEEQKQQAQALATESEGASTEESSNGEAQAETPPAQEAQQEAPPATEADTADGSSPAEQDATEEESAEAEEEEVEEEEEEEDEE